MAKPSNLRIEDVGAATARADLNYILISLASLQTTDGAGTGYTGEPTTTYPNMLWYDKATDTLKMRSEADDAWITLGTLNQSLDTFAASIELANQAEAEAGSNNTKAMTPLRTAQAISQLSLSNYTEHDLGLLSLNTGSVSHGLGSYPTLTEVFIQCVSANQGYDVGDRISFMQVEAANTDSNGFVVWYSASQVGFAHNAPLLMVTKTGGVGSLDASSWRVYVRVWP